MASAHGVIILRLGRDPLKPVKLTKRGVIILRLGRAPLKPVKLTKE